MALFFILVALIFLVIGLLWPRSTTKEELAQKTSNPEIPTTAIPAYLERRRMERQEGFIHAADRLKETILESDRLEDRHQQKVEKEDWQHESEVAVLENTIVLTHEATQQKLDSPTYLSIQQKYEFNKLDLDKRWEEVQQDLKAGFIYQMEGHQHLDLLREYIASLYDKADTYRQQGKNRAAELTERHIKYMEEDFDERARLLQANNRKEIQGGYEDTESGGSGREAMAAE